MDSQNYVNVNNPTARAVLTIEHNLSDIFRQLHPKIKRFTWRRRRTMKQARLDHVIVTNSLMDIVQTCKLLLGYRSDHSRIELNLFLNSFTKGKGLWRLNRSLLRDPNYVKCVKTCSNDEKTICCPSILTQ